MQASAGCLPLQPPPYAAATGENPHAGDQSWSVWLARGVLCAYAGGILAWMVFASIYLHKARPLKSDTTCRDNEVWIWTLTVLCFAGVCLLCWCSTADNSTADNNCDRARARAKRFCLVFPPLCLGSWGVAVWAAIESDQVPGSLDCRAYFEADPRRNDLLVLFIISLWATWLQTTVQIILYALDAL